MFFTWVSSLFLALGLLQGAVGQTPKQEGAAKLSYTKESGKAANTPVAGYHRVGLFLAGMPAENGVIPISGPSEADWKSYGKGLADLWNNYENVRLGKMREWGQAELAKVQDSSSTLFYPFGGPDALHALTFFPKAKTHILIGLERPGTLPDVTHSTDAQIKKLYQDVDKSLQSILRLSFFRTLDMDSDLRTSGTLPIVLLFIARMKYTVKDVRDVALAADGSVLAGEALGATKTTGYEIRFEDRNGEEHKLYYVRVDLSDAGLKAHPEFATFVKSFGKVNTFVKSASYLMHMAGFETVRDLIINQSAALLEDDSGIPYRYFVPKVWDITLYGVYEKPIDMFANWTQENLRKAYDEQLVPVRPLPMSIGYGKARKSNLLLAVRKPI